MKAVCNREGLLTAFQLGAAVVPTRSPKPILRNVRLDLGSDAVLSATDLELGIRYKVSGVTVQEPGEAILPTAEMTAILRELDDEAVELVSTESGVRVIGEFSKFELPGEDPLQFPQVPDLAEASGHKIKSGAFQTMIRRTTFAAASENSRFALHSVAIEFEDQTARVIATDGKRLAMMTGPVTIGGEVPEGVSLLALKALSLIHRVLLDPDEDIEIVLQDNAAVLRTPKVSIYSRLVEGRFPRYQDVIPKETNISVPLVVGKFASVIRQSKIVTSEDSKGVRFKFSSGLLTLESKAAEVGQSEIKLPIGFDGQEIAVTYDPQFLLDALKVLDAEEEITLNLVDERKASVMKTSDDYTYVVMPLTKDA